METNRSINQMADDQDLIYQAAIKMDAIGVAARKKDKYERVRKPFFTPVDQEAIDEYNEQFKSPVHEVAMPDGTVVTRKYAALPDEELPVITGYTEVDDLDEADRPLNVREVDMLRNRMVQYGDHITNLNEELQNIFEAKNTATKDYNEGRFVKAGFNKRIGRLTEADRRIKVEITAIQDEINRMRHALDNNTRNVTNFQAIIENEKKYNLENIKEYQSKLQMLNTGMFTPEQLPGESPEDYLDRIQENAEQIQPEMQLDNAQRYALKNFRIKMKELFRDDVKISQIANSFDLEDKIKILKMFPALKKKFLLRFGFDNKYLPEGDIKEYMQEFLDDSIDSDIVRKSKKEADLLEQEYMPREPMGGFEEARDDLPKGRPFPSTTGLTIIARNEDLMVANRDGEKVFFRFVIDEESVHHLLWSNSDGERGSYTEYFNNKKTQSEYGYQEVCAYLEIEPEQLFEDVFLTKSKNPAIKTMCNTMKKHYKVSPSEEYFINEQEYKGKQHEIVGWGIQTEKIPKLVEFGKVFIKPRKLYYDNVLAIRGAAGKSFKSLRDVKVSDKFVKMLMHMIKGDHKDVDISDIQELPGRESTIYHDLVHMAQLHKQLPIDKKKLSSKTDIKKRLQILQGEILAGNNNPELLEEIHYILVKLIHLGEIEESEAEKYMAQF